MKSQLIATLMIMGTLLGAQSSTVFYAPMEGPTNQIRSVEHNEYGAFIAGGYWRVLDSFPTRVVEVPVISQYVNGELDTLVTVPSVFSPSTTFAYEKAMAVFKDSLYLFYETLDSDNQQTRETVYDIEGNLYGDVLKDFQEPMDTWGLDIIDTNVYLRTELGVGTQNRRGVLESKYLNGDIRWSQQFNEGILNNSIRYVENHSDTSICVMLREQDGGTGNPVEERQLLKTLDKRTGEVILDLDVTSYLDENFGPAPFTIAENGDLIWFQRSNTELTPVSQGNIVRRTFPDLDPVWEAILPIDLLGNNRNYKAYDVKEASNGDILTCGTVSQCPRRFGPLNGELCQFRSFVSRYTADGELLWHRVFSVPNEFLPVEPYNRYVDSYLLEVYERSDGSLITAGSASYRQNAAFANHPDSTDSWYMILELDGETGCLAGEECVEDIVLDGQVIDTTGLIFPVGTQWTYEYRELESLRIVHSTVTFEVVDTLDFGGRSASRVVSTLGDTIYLSEEGMNVYVYDDRIDDYVLTFDFDANNRYSDSITYYRPFEDDFALTQVRVDSLGLTNTGEDRGFEMTQFIEYDVITELPILDQDTFTFTNTIVELIGRLYGGGVVRSPFHWANAPAGIEQLPFPSYGALRCFSTPSVEIDFLPLWPPESCDTTYFEYLYPWSLEQVDPDRIWYVLQDEPGSDRLVTRSYGLSRDSFLLSGDYYHLVVRSDVEDIPPATPTDYYLREQDGAVYRYEGGRERLVYDINHRPGDRVPQIDNVAGIDELVCIGVDTIFNPFVGSRTMRRQLYYAAVVDGQVTADTCMTVLSGIGTLEGIEFGNPVVCGGSLQLNCMLDRSWIEYHYERFGDVDDCWVLSTAVDDVSRQGGSDAVRIYPNPASNLFTIDLSNYDGDVRQVRILDVNGQLVSVWTPTTQPTITISRGSLVDGLYVCQIIDQNGDMQTFKVVFN